MTLEILTPEASIYNGNVYGIQLPGIDGLFEVLDRHAPMVSALAEGKMKILLDKNNSKTYHIEGGFVEILDNKASVLLESAREI